MIDTNKNSTNNSTNKNTINNTNDFDVLYYRHSQHGN